MGTIQKYLALGVSLGLLGCGGELATRDRKKSRPLYNGRNLDGWETKGSWMAEPNGGVFRVRGAALFSAPTPLASRTPKA